MGSGAGTSSFVDLLSNQTMHCKFHGPTVHYNDMMKHIVLLYSYHPSHWYQENILRSPETEQCQYWML